MYIHEYYNKDRFRWDPRKSEDLKRERGVSFEDILVARFVGAIRHPTRANQLIFLFELEGYVWAVPAVVGVDGIFLKTLFASRKYTKKWRRSQLS